MQPLVASSSLVCLVFELMSNENSLWEDMEKLNALYEELCWGHDDELVFTHDGEEIIIYNKTKGEKQ